MGDDDDRSFEARFFERHPSLRQEILDSPAFQNMLGGIGTINVDGETIYLLGGDQQKDIDQIVLMWGLEHGLISKDIISAAQQREK